MDIERELEKIIVEQCSSTDPRAPVTVATTSGARGSADSEVSPIVDVQESEPRAHDSPRSRGEVCAELLPDLDQVGYKIGVRTPLRIMAALLTITCAPLLIALISDSSSYNQLLNEIFPFRSHGNEGDLKMYLIIAIAYSQLELTLRWSRALDCMHGALKLYTKGQYPIGPASAERIGYLACPILIPLFMTAAFNFSAMLQPVDPSIYQAVSPWMEIGKSVFGLFVLLVVSNAITLGTFFSHVHLFGKLVPWINASSSSDKQLNPNLMFLIPLALVLPATWAIWSFPEESFSLYLVLAPLATMFIFEKLSQINEHLRDLMAPHTVQVTHPRSSDFLWWLLVAFGSALLLFVFI